MQKSQQPARKEKQEKKTDKLRVVLDTNVIVSALLTPEGIPAQVLSLVALGTVQTCYNQAILDEYEEVLSRPKFKPEITRNLKDLVLDPLKAIGSPFIVFSSVFPMNDESDRPFYDVAKAASAFLITGNKRHYPDEPFIMTPREFLDTFITLDQSIVIDTQIKKSYFN